MALDGRRRLLALQGLRGEAKIAADNGVKVEVARDKALQAAAIVVSNTQRAPVHVADVTVAITKPKSLKMTSAKIAAALGYAEIEVERPRSRGRRSIRRSPKRREDDGGAGVRAGAVRLQR